MASKVCYCILGAIVLVCMVEMLERHKDVQTFWSHDPENREIIEMYLLYFIEINHSDCFRCVKSTFSGWRHFRK